MEQLQEYGSQHRHFIDNLPLMDYTQLNSNSYYYWNGYSYQLANRMIDDTDEEEFSFLH